MIGCTRQTFEKIIGLIGRSEVIISNHGYDELVKDGMLVKEIIAGVNNGRQQGICCFCQP